MTFARTSNPDHPSANGSDCPVSCGNNDRCKRANFGCVTAKKSQRFQLLILRAMAGAVFVFQSPSNQEHKHALTTMMPRTHAGFDIIPDPFTSYIQRIYVIACGQARNRPPLTWEITLTGLVVLKHGSLHAGILEWWWSLLCLTYGRASPTHPRNTFYSGSHQGRYRRHAGLTSKR